jgi:tRNA-specific 2-thiouridylase
MNSPSTYARKPPKSSQGRVADDRVVVGFSGGIHGAVVAALLKAQGRQVVPVHLSLKSRSTEFRVKCITEPEERLKSAERMASRLGLSLKVVDASEEFHAFVEDPFIHERLNQRYQSPCLSCHKDFKVGALLREAERLNIQNVATGHRVVLQKDQITGDSRLVRSSSSELDHSFFLSGLSQKELRSLEFPLGELPETVVRKLAIEIEETYIEEKPQLEPCLADDLSVNTFFKATLSSYFQNPGLVRLGGGGSVLGEHRGVWQYSSGRSVPAQAQSMVGEKGDWIIAAYDSTQNTFAVISRADWPAIRWILHEVHFVIPQDRFSSASVKVRVLKSRSSWPNRATSYSGRFLLLEAGRALLEFDDQQAVGLLVGETVVLESNQEVLGQARVYAPLERQKTSAGQQDAWGVTKHES